MKRFENAALILYNAFNNGTLDQNRCEACAVGNLLGHSDWFGSSNTSKTAIFVKAHKRKPISIGSSAKNTSNYKINELSNIEKIFLNSFVGLRIKEEKSKDNQYKALMNVLEYLAELDGITIPEVTIESFKSVLITA
jgi:hypothetical protein